jgi:hypothetical protein
VTPERLAKGTGAAVEVTSLDGDGKDAGLDDACLLRHSMT